MTETRFLPALSARYICSSAAAMRSSGARISKTSGATPRETVMCRFIQVLFSGEQCRYTSDRMRSDAFGGGGGGGRGAAVQHYDELLAPGACRDVVRPDRLAQGFGHADKRLIPGGMRVLIVVGLEVVNIQDDAG
jgi:hypothetical protein